MVVFTLLYFVISNKWLGKWELYENSRYGFSLEYPTNWKLGDQSTNNDGREFSAPGGGTTCRAYGFSNALTGAGGEPQTLDEFITWLTGPESEEKIIEKTKTTLSGKKAVYFHSSFNEGEKDAVYSLGKETGIGLYCTYKNTAEKEKNKAVFDHMRENLKINLDLDTGI